MDRVWWKRSGGRDEHSERVARLSFGRSVVDQPSLSRLGARRRLRHSSRVVGTAAHVGEAGDLLDNHCEGYGCIWRAVLTGCVSPTWPCMTKKVERRCDQGQGNHRRASERAGWKKRARGKRDRCVEHSNGLSVCDCAANFSFLCAP